MEFQKETDKPDVAFTVSNVKKNPADNLVSINGKYRKYASSCCVECT